MAVTINADTTNGLVMTPDTSGEIKLQSAGADIVSVTANGMAVDTNTLYVDATNHNVGIGTSSPTTNVTISPSSIANGLDLAVDPSNATRSGRIFFSNGTAGQGVSMRNEAGGLWIGTEATAGSSSGTERMKIDSNGRLDVAQPLMYLGSGQAMRCSNSQYVQDATRASGYIQFGTTVGAVGVNYFVSDANKKENIQPSTYNSSLLVENIEFVEFNWKPDAGDEGHVQVGVTAQQLKTLDERLVAELEDRSFMVKEPALVTHLAKALQEQIQKVKDLETRIQVLENA